MGSIMNDDACERLAESERFPCEEASTIADGSEVSPGTGVSRTGRSGGEPALLDEGRPQLPEQVLGSLDKAPCVCVPRVRMGGEAPIPGGRPASRRRVQASLGALPSPGRGHQSHGAAEEKGGGPGSGVASKARKAPWTSFGCLKPRARKEARYLATSGA